METLVAPSATASSTPAPAIEGRHLSRRYGATQALDDVTIRLHRGHVTAIAGENGAGKSTLIRILTGIERPDEGQVVRQGRDVRFANRHDATIAGIFCVYQDQPYVPHFAVHRQVFLGYEANFRTGGLIRDDRMRSACADLCDEFGLGHLDVNDTMRRLTPASRAVVALLSVVAASRILGIDHPVILLDEPTSALSAEELVVLRAFIDVLRERSAIAFVSHRIGEVLEWADTIVVLRDGRNADEMSRDTASVDRIHLAMGGRRDRKPVRAPGRTRSDVGAADGHTTTPRLAAEGLTLRPGSPSFAFDVQPGETVGVAGVEGSGKGELLRACAGLPDSVGPATVTVDGTIVKRAQRPLLAHGVAYLSGDRQVEGVLPKLSITENIALSRRVVGRSSASVISWPSERARAERVRQELSIRTAGVDAPLASLSGGNQQKVLLGRVLEIEPRLLLLDNVTRGVDVGTRENIYDLFARLASDGTSLVLASDDLEELVAVADRIVVMRDGTAVHIFDNRGGDVEPAEILARMVLDPEAAAETTARKEKDDE